MSKQKTTKGDKHGKTAAPTATPQNVNPEIIMGKFTESDWMAVLTIDDNEEYVNTIVGEVLNRADQRIKEIELERQLAPYTVNKVLDFVVDLFKFAYPEHQDEQQIDPSWEADVPPKFSQIDSWAEGSVPKQVVSTAPVILSVNVLEEQEEVKEKEEPDTSNIVQEFKKVADEKSDQELTLPGGANSQLAIPKPPEEKIVKPHLVKKKFKPNVSVSAVRRAAGIDDPQDDQKKSVENKDAIAPSISSDSQLAGSKAAKTALIAAVGKASLQREKGRPPMERDVNYDSYGNIISMIRISPESFPPLFVQTDYMVVDPRVEKANAALEAMRTGRYFHKKSNARHAVKLKPMKMTPGLAAAQFTAERKKSNESAREMESSNPTQVLGQIPLSTRRKSTTRAADRLGNKVIESKSIIEQIDLSPGVEMREGSQEKRGADLRAFTGAVFMRQDTDLLSMTQKPQVTEQLMEVGQFVTKAPSIKPIV